MLGIANYSMKGPKQAAIAVVLSSALSVILAPIGLITGGLIALVTLRISSIEGFKSLALAVVAQLAVTMMITGNALPAFIAIMEFLLPVWVLSVVLRETQSFAKTLQAALIFIAIGLALFHLSVSDTAAYWLALYNETIAPVLAEAKVEYDLELITQLANMVTMLIAVFALVLWFSIVLIGRWWQSQLYAPGQFRKDFYELRVSSQTAYAGIAISIASLALGQTNGLIYDLTGLFIAVFMFQGLAIAHATVDQKQASVGWLVGIYILLFIFPQTMLILATLGLIDTWMDFRRRWDSE
ncbi:DUF2232 domain-containing protein [Thiomicrorhabdus indica]|uniref:DUF2232 domain-containing protein n=1 Tax=Thiomicrorhabdus indica TaxID=2267253 RepID=UPI00102DC86C|nr:DUF2232 domain-containing protein [Thiomicrorhabdus indica]